jgi:mono/diheme cytochrome c family protein
MTARSKVFLIAASLAAAVAFFLVDDPFAVSTDLRPSDARLLAIGQRVYEKHCAACHGVKLEGQPNWRSRDEQGRLPAPPHDASGHTWHHPDAVLFRLTKYGIARTSKMPNYNSAMPVYEGVLTDEEIVAVLSWIKAQWPAATQAQHDKINANAKNKR